MGAVTEARRAAALLRGLGASTHRRSAARGSTFGLTERELQVLGLVGQGMSNKQIAAELVLSEHTVRRHVANILKKLDVPSRAAAAVLATRHDLV